MTTNRFLTSLKSRFSWNHRATATYRRRTLRFESLGARELFAANVFDAPDAVAEAPVVEQACDTSDTTQATCTAAIQNGAMAPWHNAANPKDVNDDSYVSPIDALLVINDLKHNGSRELPQSGPSSENPRYIDVDGDGFVAAVDALAIINSLNASFQPEGEGHDDAGNESADALPTLTVSDVTIGEPLVGKQRFANFTVSLNHAPTNSGFVPSLEAVTVAYETKDGSAVGGNDFETTSGNITFDQSGPTQLAPGYDPWTREIRVPILVDFDSEGTEFFTVELSHPVNATLADSVGKGTILNNYPVDEFANSTASTRQSAEGEGASQRPFVGPIARKMVFGATDNDWLSDV